MSQLPQNVSEAVKQLNPHLYCSSNLSGNGPQSHPEAPGGIESPQKRIRQSAKPLMNKLEQEWFDHLCLSSHRKLIAQEITFRIANGLRYTPDIFCFEWPDVGGDGKDHPTAFEVKGYWFTDDANAKLKMFAAKYPEIRVFLVWKDNDQAWRNKWRTQRVLP